MQKHILLIGTGGTIACGHSSEGLKPLLSSRELLDYVPGAEAFCRTDTIQLMNIDSTNMEPPHWLQIASCIEEHYEEYDGFVICHGTDTMAYTAAALSYLIQNSRKPIVVTGAQRPIDLENTDARTNLMDSLRYAAFERAYGVNLVFDGKVIAGTRARKERSKSYNAFSSINYPYIATVYEDRVLLYFDDKDSLQGDVCFYHSLNSRVGLLKLIPSMTSRMLDWMAQEFDAVIIESFGVGGLPSYANSHFYETVRKWVDQGKVFLMATQVAQEGSNLSVYEVGKRVKTEIGLLESYDMTLESSVTKLMWILAQTRDAREINRMFLTTINRDILWK